MKLEIKNGVLGYGSTVVLENVNFALHSNETVCVLGKNGVGKTTFFKALLGMLKPHAGTILLNDKPIDYWDKRKFAQLVGYIPQARSLPFPFRVLDFVLFGRTAHIGTFSYPDKKDKMIAEECLEILNIRHLIDRIFTQLSGGEQQMVMVARALAQQPAFLIMDEPTSSLDFGNQIKIIKRINELKNNSLGILMATHSPDHAFMCDAQVALVHDKSIWQYGYSNDIITEEVLKTIYGVDVKIREMEVSGDTARMVCVPTI